MKILILSAAYPPQPGGVATHVGDLSHGLVHLGHEVSVITTSNDSKLRRQRRGRLHVWKLPKKNTPEFHGRRVFGESVVEFVLQNWHIIRPDIIHAHDLDSLLIAWLLKSIFGTKAVLSVHRAPSPWRAGRYKEDPKDAFLESFRRVRGVDGIVVPSEASAEVLRQQGFEFSALKVIPHGIGHYLRSEADRSETLTTLRWEPSQLWILCPSRADEHKDVETFLDAACLVRQNFDGPDRLRFILCCSSKDTHYPRIQSTLSRLGFRENTDVFIKQFSFKEMATVYRRMAMCRSFAS